MKREMPKYGTPEYEAWDKINHDCYQAVEWLRLKMASMVEMPDHKARMDTFHDVNNTFLNIRGTIAHIEAGGYIHFCSMCGKPEKATYIEPKGQKLKKNGLCFHCDSWVEKRTRYNAEGRKGPMLVINGDGRSDGGAQPDNQNKAFMGFGGSRFHLYNLVTGELWTTNNLWSYGEIPDNFRAGMPDNAVYLTKEQYELAIIGRNDQGPESGGDSHSCTGSNERGEELPGLFVQLLGRAPRPPSGDD